MAHFKWETHTFTFFTFFKFSYFFTFFIFFTFAIGLPIAIIIMAGFECDGFE